MEELRYVDIRPTLKDLDLVLFKGNQFTSNVVSWFQSHTIHRPNTVKYAVSKNAFTHCGIVISRELINDDRLEKGKLYILESTMSGPLNDNVYNINGKSFIGVQIRDLDSVVYEYNARKNTKVGFAKLKSEVLDEKWGGLYHLLSENLTELVHKYEGTRYDGNPLSLLASLLKFLRPWRKKVEKAASTENWLFCSELVALIYKSLRLFSVDVEPKNVVPMDFIGYDQDSLCEGGIPVILEEPFYVLT